MKARETNLYLKGRGDERPLEIGKVVLYQGEFVYHYWAHPKDMRHSQRAWGMREGILSWLLDHNVKHVYIYDKVASLTYYLPLEILLQHTIRGKTDQYGGTLNIPLNVWIQKRGKIGVPFIPGSTCEFVDPNPGKKFSAFAPPERTQFTQNSLEI